MEFFPIRYSFNTAQHLMELAVFEFLLSKGQFHVIHIIFFYVLDFACVQFWVVLLEVLQTVYTRW